MRLDSPMFSGIAKNVLHTMHKFHNIKQRQDYHTHMLGTEILDTESLIENWLEPKSGKQ